MDNVIDKALKRVLKFARSLSIVKTLLYLFGGIVILVLNEEIIEYIYLIVGVDLLLTSLLEIIEEIVKRKYRKTHNHFGSALFTMIAGIMILTIFHRDIYNVSVMWACATIVDCTIEINEGLHEIYERKAFSIINLAFAITEIVFSIWLLVEPEANEEHFITHIYLLGAGFILESVEALFRTFINFFKEKEEKKKIENKETK